MAVTARKLSSRPPSSGTVSTDPDDYWRRLQRLRSTLGLSQRELAEWFGVTHGAVAQWESRRQKIPGPAIKLLVIYETELSLEPSLGDVDVGGGRPIAQEVEAAVLRQSVRTLSGLKGLSIKVAQMASCITSLLPPEQRLVLEKMPQTAKPMPSTATCAVFLTELHRLPSELFAEWSPRPIATASIGQVHKARTQAGDEVAVKVQCPRTANRLMQDVRTAGQLDVAFSLLVSRSQERGILIEELSEHVLRECDYELEARYQRRFWEIFEGHPTISIPEPIAELCSPRVLTSRWMNGMPIEAFDARATQEQRDRAVTAIWDFYYQALVRYGVFNTDPHPSNFLLDERGVQFLDFGRIKALPRGHLDAWKRLVRAVLEHDIAGCRHETTMIGCAPDPDDFDFFHSYRSLVATYRPYLIEGGFTFTTDFVRTTWRASFGPHNVNRNRRNYPRDFLFVDALHLGVGSILARIRGSVDARARMLDLLYGEDEPRPAPFSEAELAALAL